jgi:hypothetical protein
MVGAVAVMTLPGCTRGLSSIAPVGFRPADRARVVAWIGELAPKAPRLYEIRPWRYRNERGAAAGRARVRVAPPDSLRFDYRGPFGRSGSAVIVGDTALWVTGGDDFEGIVTFVPLLWTALGLPQMPPESASVFDLVGDDFRAWRYIVAGDTLDFVLRGSPAERLEGEIRRQGVVLGQVRVELDTQTGLALRSQIDFWNVSRFELTMNSVDTLANFDSTTWKKQ